MIDLHTGYSVAEDIHYCPACGTAITSRRQDGTAWCNECGARVAVIYIDDLTDPQDKGATHADA